MHAGRGSPAVPFPVTLFVLFTHGFVDGLGERLHGLAASGTDDQRIGLDSVGDWIPGKSNAMQGPSMSHP